ncbi:hypothetical protein E4P42_10450 [Mycobacterium sp. PS03-16]|uniref:hypothetical protein n=1 Tax=Mycobacterium sp. PS03-16 TaxID=2559611 RepID=UPI0010733421|nr:hypothetical protein [Mycobacterium sp. PS03-16]TFV58907.1 hypothetical protein E4P42_10450 [Mycobacterium sp. PS03-16]
MTAYDPAAWADFAQTVAGGAAALAGLLFVGLSLNLSDVLAHRGVPARAAVTLGLTIAILLITVLLATPGQPLWALAAEVGMIGLVLAAGALTSGLHDRRNRSRGRTLYLVLVPLLPALLFVTAAVSLLSQAGGGLYWLTAGVVAGFFSATANSWVLLVEIKR